MSQKKIDISGQIEPSQMQSKVNYHNGITLDFWRSHEIPSENTTHEKLGQTVNQSDLRDNLDIKRMPEVLESDLKRLNKYLKAYNELIKL